jgi:hypothetical protein
VPSFAYVKFRKIGPSSDPWEWVPTDFHGVAVGRGIADCGNRYHLRFWGDFRHEQLSNTTHSQSQAWIIAGAHYEELGTGEGGGPAGAGHSPQLGWEVVEHRIVQFMRPHSYSFRWKCLPNSWGMYQNYRSDGRISRISINHGRGDTTKATRENGQC